LFVLDTHKEDVIISEITRASKAKENETMEYKKHGYYTRKRRDSNVADLARIAHWDVSDSHLDGSRAAEDSRHTNKEIADT
jgi:hypothetical protein